jgi:hypothetical protein
VSSRRFGAEGFDVCGGCAGALSPDELAALLPHGRTFKTLPGGGLVDVTADLEREVEQARDREIRSEAFMAALGVNRHALRKAAAARRRRRQGAPI